MRQLLILGLAVIGLQFGCGGGEADMGMQSDLTSREDPLLRCLSEYRITYYTDATLSTWAGTERCYCGRTPALTGSRTDFGVEDFISECL
uniref:Uncharacterized protein n=1 Tax=Myxococcus fulvus TaxID=33 RepID=A0A3Q8I912_MYXFU|nr:hypothetical protein [Myxococcus fulvus]